MNHVHYVVLLQLHLKIIKKASPLIERIPLFQIVIVLLLHLCKYGIHSMIQHIKPRTFWCTFVILLPIYVRARQIYSVIFIIWQIWLATWQTRGSKKPQMSTRMGYTQPYFRRHKVNTTLICVAVGIVFKFVDIYLFFKEYCLVKYLSWHLYKILKLFIILIQKAMLPKLTVGNFIYDSWIFRFWIHFLNKSRNHINSF